MYTLPPPGGKPVEKIKIDGDADLKMTKEKSGHIIALEK